MKKSLIFTALLFLLVPFISWSQSPQIDFIFFDGPGNSADGTTIQTTTRFTAKSQNDGTINYDLIVDGKLTTFTVGDNAPALLMHFISLGTGEGTRTGSNPFVLSAEPKQLTADYIQDNHVNISFTSGLSFNRIQIDTKNSDNVNDWTFAAVVSEEGGDTPVDPGVDTSWREKIGGGYWIFASNRPGNGDWYGITPGHDSDNVFTYSKTDFNVNNNIEEQGITAIELTVTGVSDLCKETFSTPIGSMTETMAKGFVLQGSNGTWTGTMTNPAEYVYNNNGEMKMRVAIPEGCTAITGYVCKVSFNNAGVIQSVAYTVIDENAVVAEPKMTVSFDYANFERTSSTGGNVTLNYTLEGRSIDGTYIDVWVDITNNHNLITNGQQTGNDNRLRLDISEPTGSIVLALEGLDSEKTNTLYPRVRWMSDNGSVIVDATSNALVGNVSTATPIDPEATKLTYSYTDWKVNDDKTISATLHYTVEGMGPDGTYIEYFIDNPNLKFTVGNDDTEYSKDNHYILNNLSASGFISLTFKAYNGHTPGKEWHKIFWKTASGATIKRNNNDQVAMPYDAASVTSDEKGSDGDNFAGNYTVAVTAMPDNKLAVTFELEGEYAGLANEAYFQRRDDNNGITGETAIARKDNSNVYAGTIDGIANGNTVAFSIKIVKEGGMCVTRTFYYTAGSGEISTVAPVPTAISATFTDWEATSRTGGNLTFSWKWDAEDDVTPTHIELFFETVENLHITANGEGCYNDNGDKQSLIIENPAKEGSMVLAIDNLLKLGNTHVWPKVRLMKDNATLANADQSTWLDTSAGATEDDLKQMRVINFSFWHGEFYTDMFKHSGESKSQEALFEFVEVGPNGKWYYKYEFSEPITITDSNQLYFSERWTSGDSEYSYNVDNFNNTGKEAHIHPYFDARVSDTWIKCSGNIDIQGNSRVRTGVKVKTIWVREDPTALKQGVNQGNFDHLEVYLSSDGSVDKSLTNYQAPENFDEYYLVAAKGTPIYNMMRGAGAPSDETQVRIRFTKHAASEGYYQINLGRNLTLNAQQEFTFIIDPEGEGEADRTDVQFAATSTNSFIASSGAARSTIKSGISFSRIILYAAPKGHDNEMAYTLWLCQPDETGALTYPQGIEGYPDFNPRNLYSLPQLKIWAGDNADNSSGYIGRIPVKNDGDEFFTEQHNWNNAANTGFFGKGMAANQKVINAAGNTYFVSFRPVIDNDADDKGSTKVSYITDEYFHADGSYDIPEGYRAVPNLFYIPLPGGVTLSKDQAGKGLTPDFNALDFFNLQGENGLTAGVPEAGGQWFYGNAWWCANPNVRYEGDDQRYMRFKPGTEGDLVVGEPMTVYGITLFRIVGNRWNMYSNREGDKFDDGNIYYLYFDTNKPEGDAAAEGINKKMPEIYIPELSCPILIDRIAGTEITPDKFDNEGNRVEKPDAFQWREIFYYDSRWGDEGQPIDFNIPMHSNPEAKKLMYYGLAANGDAQYVCDFPKNGGYCPNHEAPFRVIDASGTQIWYEDGEVILPAKYSSYFLGRREHTLFNLLDKNSAQEKFQIMKANGCVGYDVNPVTGAATTPIASTAAIATRVAGAPDPTAGALTLARPDVSYTRLILATNRDNLRVLMKASVPVIEANSNMIFDAPEKEEIGKDEAPSPITPYVNVKVTVPYNNYDIADGSDEHGNTINNKTIDIDLWFNGKTNADESEKNPDFSGHFTVIIDKWDENGVALSGHATGEIDGRTVTFPVTVLTEDRTGDDVYLNQDERILVFDMPFVIDTQDTADGEEAFSMDNVVADVKIGNGGKNVSNNVESALNVPVATVKIVADDPTVSNDEMSNNEFHACLNWTANATGNLPKKYIVYSWADEKVPAGYPAEFENWTDEQIAEGVEAGWIKKVYIGTSEKDAYRHTYDAISYNDTKDETGTQAEVNMHYGVVLTYNYRVPAGGAPVMVSYPASGDDMTPVIDDAAKDLLTDKTVSDSDTATLKYELNKTVTGIGDIEAEEGEIRWYTVDGIRVAAPAQGRIYIRVANGHATTVLF